jgi:hypothetical protein
MVSADRLEDTSFPRVRPRPSLLEALLCRRALVVPAVFLEPVGLVVLNFFGMAVSCLVLVE